MRVRRPPCWAACWCSRRCRRRVRAGREPLHDDRHHPAEETRANERDPRRPYALHGRGDAGVAARSARARRRDRTTCRCGCPTRRATSPTSRQFQGQTLDAARGAAAAYYAHPLLRHDGRRLGRRRFTLRYDDGSTQTSTSTARLVPVRHARRTSRSAAGQRRWTPTGEDGAPCASSTSADRRTPDGARAVTLPPATDRDRSDARAYLMALTLESSGGCSACRTSRASTVPERQDRRPCPRSVRPGAPTARRLVQDRPRDDHGSDEEGGAGVEQTYRTRRRPAAAYSRVRARRRRARHARVPRDRRRGQRRGFSPSAQGRRERARDRGGLSRRRSARRLVRRPP